MVELFADRKLRTENQLRNEGFTDEDLIEHRAAQEEYLALLGQYRLAEEEKRYEDAAELETPIGALAVIVHFRGMDPKTIPIETLRYITQKAPDTRHDDPVCAQYRTRVKSKAPSIRAKCVTCMNGQPTMVRDCPSTTCPLWPFRMGTNPLRGALRPPIKDAPLLDEALQTELAQEIVENEDKEADDNANI